jgi:hypothetical protein
MQATVPSPEVAHGRGALTRVYRLASLGMAVAFAFVGLAFLAAPGAVTGAFDALSVRVGMAPSGEAVGFYLILAVAYMYLVTLLAGWMYLRPENPVLPVLLVNAKAASALLSFCFFALREPALIYLVNGVVDGLIALGVWLLYRGMQPSQ